MNLHIISWPEFVTYMLLRRQGFSDFLWFRKSERISTTYLKQNMDISAFTIKKDVQCVACYVQT